MDHHSFIIEMLQKASSIAKPNFGRVGAITQKEGDNNQVLTETDIAIGKLLIQLAQEKYPEYNIIDEEAGVIDNGSEYTWVFDPIDGTSNFAQGVPLFGIIIGLLHKDQPVAGGFALPFFDEIAVASKGKGAHCNGERLKVTSESRLLSSLAAYAIDGHQENPEVTYEECHTLADIVLGVRNLRAAGSVYDGMLVAKGKYGIYLNRTSKIWDNIGQHIVIEEAGGIYTDFFGNPMDYSNPLSKAKQNFTWCIGAPNLHKQVQEIIHKTKSK